MMKHAVLINNSYVENLSVRYLGAYLKHKGFRVSIIHYEGRKDDVFNLLPEESLKLLSEYCRDCDLVGISLLTTHQLKRSIQISNYLKGKIKAKIIWGGRSNNMRSPFLSAIRRLHMRRRGRNGYGGFLKRKRARRYQRVRL